MPMAAVHSERSPLKKPWFTFNYNPDAEVAGDRWTGEDYWFCGLLREAGIQVYCDADLSRQVQHIGEVEYKTEQIR